MWPTILNKFDTPALDKHCTTTYIKYEQQNLLTNDQNKTFHNKKNVTSEI